MTSVYCVRGLTLRPFSSETRVLPLYHYLKIVRRRSYYWTTIWCVFDWLYVVKRLTRKYFIDIDGSLFPLKGCTIYSFAVNLWNLNRVDNYRVTLSGIRFLDFILDPVCCGVFFLMKTRSSGCSWIIRTLVYPWQTAQMPISLSIQWSQFWTTSLAGVLCWSVRKIHYGIQTTLTKKKL